MSHHKSLLRKVDGDICKEIYEELQRARASFPNLNSSYEGYAVILEELDEFWDEVKAKQNLRNHKNMRAELIQVAAMCVRTIVDVLAFEKAD